MNAGAKKGLIWGLVLTGVGLGIYYLTKSIKDKRAMDESDMSEEDQIVSEITNNASTESKVNLDNDRWVEKGSRGIEVKYIQWGINNIIGAAKKIKSSDKYNYLSSSDKARINALSKMKTLEGDGMFGDKTLSAVKTVEGKTGTNYCLIQKRRVAFHAKYKLKNPYGDMPICKDKMVTA